MRRPGCVDVGRGDPPPVSAVGSSGHAPASPRRGGSWAHSRAAPKRPRSLASLAGRQDPAPRGSRCQPRTNLRRRAFRCGVSCRVPRRNRTRVTLVSHLCGLCIVRDQDVARPVGLLNACAKCAATAAAVPTAARTAAAPRTDAPLDHTTGQKATLRARECPQAGAPAMTDEVQSITDVGLTTCLSIPSSLGSRPSARPTSWGRCRTGNPSSRPT
jgi:hypothetical protein